MNKTSVTIEFAGKTLELQTGFLAPQATASIYARLGDTVVLATVTMGGERADLDYFPLSVEYVEKLYAGGRIKGSRWVKREGRPTDDAILTGRLIDRSIRPLFPKEFKREVQVIATVLSVDGEHEADIVALNAVSAALAISSIPWNGPIAAIRMGYIKASETGEGAYVANPTSSEIEHSELDLVVSQTSDNKTLMIEAGALQVPEDVMAEANIRAHEDTQKMLAGIAELVKKVGQKKLEVPVNTALQEIVKKLEKSYKAQIGALAATRANKEGSGSETSDLIATIVENEKKADSAAEVDKKLIAKAVEYVMFKLIRHEVVVNGKRPDNRKLDEIRELTMEVGILPRTHGSAIFQRGLTQALTIVTLGSPRMELLIESAEGEESKRYIHHYSAAPFSVGEAGRIGTPSRREIGHGALAERALMAVIPSQEVFPYTIRLVSEVLSQNGSSSMASTCGSTLALMDAGVPIIKPVAGISIGRMSEGDKATLLTDIIGLEDFSGDMDFKVAGTDSGITAIQLDVKIPGLTDEEVTEILSRAQTARMQILKKMLAALPESRQNLSEYAPKIEMLKIPVEKIGELIGPGGKTIKNIIAQTGATVDVEDDGSVTVSGVDDEAVKKAYDWVSNMMREITPGEVFEGTVKRILPFGAFVEFLPGKEGMVHVSKMSNEYVNNPEEVVQLGQTVTVKVSEVDDQGRINLTMRLEEPNNDAGSGSRGGPREGGSRDGGSRGGGGFSSGPRSAGPRSYPSGPRTTTAGENRGFDRRNDRGGDRGERQPHPLSQQFEREKREQSNRTARGPRKAHY